MKIDLNELEIYPLSSEELSLWINSPSELEEKLGCVYCGEPVTRLLSNIAQLQLILGMSKPLNFWFWYTFWFLIRKVDRKVLGVLHFKGKPDLLKGEVEIGYSLGKSFKHKGYMTRAVQALCDWAKNKENVRRIVAETAVDNLLSQRLLKRCGFVKCSQTETSFWFKLE